MINISGMNSLPISVWQGGRTSEIYIYPEKAKYSDRKFLFRVSTSTVELQESDFTVLPDYTRLIAVIDGEMYLTHSDSTAACHLVPMETVHTFDGGAQTHCVGKCTDVNLMLAKGKAKGDLWFANQGDVLELNASNDEFIIVYGLVSGSILRVNDGEIKFTLQERSAVFYVKIILE